MQQLKGKIIYLFGTGARKISLLPKAIREFTSDGARVYTMMSDMGMEICGSLISDFDIPRNQVVRGYSKERESLPLEDLVLVAPCTFNTLNKIANGIADTYALTITANAIGSGRKVIVAPAMNQSLWEHPATIQSLKSLQQWGCQVVWPEITPEKVTMAPIEKVTDSVYYSLTKVRYESEQIPIDSNYQKIVNENHFEFRRVGKEMLDIALTKGVGGCICKRVGAGILVSSSGSQIGSLSRNELSLIKRKKGKKLIWQGKKRPSSESPLFYELLRHSKNTIAVIHGHCPKITYNQKMERYATPEYIRYGIFNQNERVIETLKRNNGFAILKLHGELSTGKSLDEALTKLKQKLREVHKLK